MNTSSLNFSNKYFKIILLSYGIFLSVLIPFVLYFNEKKILAILFAPILLILLLDNFNRYIKIGLMITMFVGYYIHPVTRLQIINIFSYILIIYFFINYKNDAFNRNRLPFSVKLSSVLLIIAVFISSINTPFVSALSIYYGFMFFIYIFTGYIIFKNIFELKDIDDYFKYFLYVCTVYGIIIIFSIFATGNMRARGITGSSFSDIIVCALIILLFLHFLLEKHNYIHYIMAVILIIILVTDQSRFAWVGFLLSLTYGVIIVSFYQRSTFIKKRIVYLGVFVFMGMILILVTGLDKIILQRFSDVSFSILQASEDKEMVANTLDMRGLIWLTSLSAFVNNPLTGVGYFMFYRVSENYNILPESVYQEIVMGLDSHSTLMNFLCETGIIGFLSILLFFIVIFVLSFKAIKLSKSSSDLSRSLVLNILVFFIVTTSVYSGAYTFGYNGYFLYFVFALVIANYILLKRKHVSVKINDLQ